MLDRPFIVGEKIYLRPLDMEDVSGPYLQWVNDFEIRQYMGTLHFPTTRQQLLAYVEKQTSNPNIAFFAVMDKETNAYIGNVKLGPIDWINRKLEYGRLLGNKEFHGKGIGTELTTLVLRYSFDELNMHKVNSSMSADNKASIRSNEKAGLKIEGVRREQKYENGVYKDIVLMGITRDEYLERY